MTEYAVLLPGDESVWEAKTPEERAAMYTRHEQFSKALEERGHKVTGGAELAHSRTARTLRSTGGAITVTDGPYAESVEQLAPYLLVVAWVDVTKILADAEGGIEIRACVDHSGD